MKRLLLSIISCTMLLSVSWAQTKLTYENHALLAGEDNPMKICNYIAPGEAGENITWDFSGLKFKENFTGYLNKTSTNMDSELFKDANTVLQEFNSKFYFNITRDGIEQLGYASYSGRTRIVYTKPFQKMKFPFQYTDEFSGYFDGQYLYDNQVKGNIDGSYLVRADATGRLILPGATVYENTVRVHTEKMYTLDLETSQQLVRINTYRWFTENYRYPILVLIEMKTKTGDRVYTQTQAAYNTDALKVTSRKDVLAHTEAQVYPTNVTTNLNLVFNSDAAGTAYAEVIDLSGKKVLNLGQLNITSGDNHFIFDHDLHTLPQGQYILHVQGNEFNIIEEFNMLR